VIKYYTTVMITIIILATLITFNTYEDSKARTKFYTLIIVFAVGAYLSVFFLVNLIQVFLCEREFLAKSIGIYIQKKFHASKCKNIFDALE